MTVEIFPSKLSGKIDAIASKSEMHRILIAKALCGERVEIEKDFSMDIKTTAECLNVLFGSGNNRGDDNIINCRESGSTLRFLLPLACASEGAFTFVGEGRLPSRPIDELVSQLQTNGAKIERGNENYIAKTNGGLRAGKYIIRGGTSSQFVSGLMFALPLLSSDSQIEIIGELESLPYVDITIDILEKFGINIIQTKNGYEICGKQKYKMPHKIAAGGDWSNAAFWLSANFLGANIEICGLHENSKQGDKQIIQIIKQFEQAEKNVQLDVANIPDLVPILAAAACKNAFDTKLINAKRLRLKESDRLFSTSECLKILGAKVEIGGDYLKVFGTNSGTKIIGGTVDSFNDHRIAMAMTIASLVSKEKITVTNAQAVNKSYPHFFEDFVSLGGIINYV